MRELRKQLPGLVFKDRDRLITVRSVTNKILVDTYDFGFLSIKCSELLLDSHVDWWEAADAKIGPFSTDSLMASSLAWTQAKDTVRKAANIVFQDCHSPYTLKLENCEIKRYTFTCMSSFQRLSFSCTSLGLSSVTDDGHWSLSSIKGSCVVGSQSLLAAVEMRDYMTGMLRVVRPLSRLDETFFDERMQTLASGHLNDTSLNWPDWRLSLHELEALFLPFLAAELSSRICSGALQIAMGYFVRAVRVTQES